MWGGDPRHHKDCAYVWILPNQCSLRFDLFEEVFNLEEMALSFRLHVRQSSHLDNSWFFSSPHPKVIQLGLFLYIYGASQVSTPQESRWAFASEWFCVWTLEVGIWAPSHFLSLWNGQTKPSQFFTARCYVKSSFQHRTTGLWSWGAQCGAEPFPLPGERSLLNCPYQCSTTICGFGSAYFMSLSHLPVSLYILS